MSRKLGFAFPGQGSQSVGMLLEYFKRSKTFNTIFDISKEVLGIDFKELINEGTAEQLSSTETTQPLLLTSNQALWKSTKLNPDQVCLSLIHI